MEADPFAKVKKMIKDHVSELKHNYSFQIAGVAAMTTQIHVYLDGRINAF